MSRLDDLPADQRNTLQLLLKHGKSYEELAGMLRFDPDAVRTRALDALDGLGPETDGLSGERQDEISDYLLGQQTASERADTRSFLEGSAAGRAWGRVVSSELRPLAGEPLPEIPAEAAEVDEAFGALQARHEARERRDQSSKVGGAILLVGLGVIVALAIIYLVGRGDDSDNSTPASTPAAKTTTTSTTAKKPSSAAATPIARVDLTSTKTNALAVGVVATRNGERSLTISGKNFAPTNGFRYGVWLYSSPTHALSLGLVPQAVAATGSTKGLIGVGADPAAIAASGATGAAQLAAQLRATLKDIFTYKELLITREPQSAPGSKPGPIVVSGTFTQIKAK